MKRQWRNRVSAIAAGLVFVGLVPLGLPMPAHAQAGPNYSLGTPPDPIQLRPGDKVEATARVVNSTSIPSSFDVKVISVDTHDQGAITEAEDRNDPAVSFVSTVSHIDVAADGSGVLPLAITVPKTTAPDIYFAGLLLTPSSSQSGGVQTVDRILSPIAIDVVGEKDVAVSVTQSVGHKFILGTKVGGSYSVANREAGVSVGRAVFIDRSFGGRVTVPIAAGHNNDQGQATSKEVIPRGHRKTFSYTWHAPATTFGTVHPLVEISYVDSTGKTVTQLSKGPGVFVLAPVILGVAIAVLLAVLVATGVLLRRRRSGKNPAPQAPA